MPSPLPPATEVRCLAAIALSLLLFMYRRPILCTLHGAVEFLKVLKIAVVGGGGVLLDGWEEVLGRIVYITSQ